VLTRHGAVDVRLWATSTGYAVELLDASLSAVGATREEALARLAEALDVASAGGGSERDDSAWIHRPGWGERRVVTPRCPSPSEESILSRDRSNRVEGHLAGASLSRRCGDIR
jgi:hypothetical protein